MTLLSALFMFAVASSMSFPVVSMVVSSAVDNYKITSKVVKDARVRLNQAGNIAARLELNWVKAHVGTLGNERADEAAKAATQKSAIDIRTPIANSWINKTVNSLIYREWAKDWSELKIARLTKQFYKFPSMFKANRVLKLNRYDLTRFINITTGHNNLNYHMSLVSKGDVSSTCRFCLLERETFFHWITECPE